MSINLLPSVQKKELRQEETWRKIFFLLLFVLAAVIILVLLLWNIRLLLLSKTKSLENSIERQNEELAAAEFGEMRRVIAESNQILAKINQFRQEQLFFAPFFEKLSLRIPESVFFTSLSLRNVKDNQAMIEVNGAGFAETREKLYLLKTELAKEKSFLEVYFLPGSWMKPQQVHFSFGLKYLENAPEK